MNKRESEGQVVGSGAFSKVWMAYINHDTLESMIQEAFGSLGSLPNRGQDEWASWCKVSDVQEQLRARQVGQKRARLVDLYRPSTLTRRILGTADESDMAQPAQTPYEVYVERGKLMPIVFKVSVADRFLDTLLPSRSQPGKFTAHILPEWLMQVQYSVPDYGHLEMLTYFVLDRFISPYLPNVPALNVCMPCDDPRIMKHEYVKTQVKEKHLYRWMPLLKVEEYLYGTTMYNLLCEPKFAKTRRMLSGRDWQSMIWQLLMAHYVMIKQTKLVHYDPHMDNVMVSLQEKPSKICYKTGSVDIVTPVSQLLVVRIDWSRSVAFDALDEWSYRFIMHQNSVFHGYFTRYKINQCSFLSYNAARYTCPLLNDWYESVNMLMNMLRRCETGIRRDTLKELIQMLETMSKDITIEMGRMAIDRDETHRMSVIEAIEAIHTKCVLEGGMTLPDRWFSLDVAPMDRLVAYWAARFRSTLGSPADAVVIQPRSFDILPTSNLSDGLSYSRLIPNISFVMNRDKLVYPLINMIKLSRQIRADSRSSSLPLELLQYAYMWDRVPHEIRDRLGDMMDRVLGNMLEKPMMHYAFGYMGKYEYLAVNQGLSAIKFAQLINASLGALGYAPVIFNINVSDTSQQIT